MKTNLLVGFAALTLAVLGLTYQNFSSLNLTPGSSYNLKMDFIGEERTYILHVPANLNTAIKSPLILALHPSGADGAGFEKITGFDAVSDQEGFFVAYPDSSKKADPPKTWDINGKDPVDLGFAVALAQEIEKLYPVDPDSVYAAGFSDGGGFTQALACDKTGSFAGVAISSAAFNEKSLPKCKPSRPMRIVYFHGTDDPIVPYNGGMSDGPDSKPHKVYSASQTAQAWVGFNKCSKNGVTATIADVLVDDGANPTKSQPTTDTFNSWTTCDGSVSVGLYTISGGGHTWPGGKSTSKWGASSKNLNASQIVWDTLKLKETENEGGSLDWKRKEARLLVPFWSTPRWQGVPYCGSERPHACKTAGKRCFTWADLQWSNWPEGWKFTEYVCK